LHTGTSKGEDAQEPTEQETISFVVRTLEHYCKYFFFGRPDDGFITDVSVASKILIYQFKVRNSEGGTYKETLYTVSIPLDRLDIGSFKVKQVDFKAVDRPIYTLQFYCLDGQCIRETVQVRVAGANDHYTDDGSAKTAAEDSGAFFSQDESEINRLAQALKHLAVLSGSPAKELFNK
jgi:hypothetical protein